MEDFGDDGDLDWDNVCSEETDPSNSIETNESRKPPLKKRRTLEPRLFPGPAGIMPKISIDVKVAKTLAKIKGKDSIKDDVLPQDNRSLSQIEKDENSLSREELIEHNEAWSAVEKDELFVPEYTKFNSDHINKEATEGVALKMPIFFCVIKSMDLLSGHDINCELIDMKGEVLGLIRREVIDDHGEELRPGTALILKDLVIYTPKNAPPFVNIAKNTVAFMYCNEPSGLSARGEPIAKLSKEDIKKLQVQADRANRIAKNAVREPAAGANSNASLMSSIGQPSPPGVRSPLTPQYTRSPLATQQRPQFSNQGSPMYQQQRPRYPPANLQARPSLPSQRPNYPQYSRPQLQQQRPQFQQQRPQLQQQRPQFQQQRPQYQQQRPQLNSSTSIVSNGSNNVQDNINDELLDGLDEESIFGDF